MAYQKGWEAATKNKEAQTVGRRWNSFEKSKEWGMLAKELHELDMSLKKNVKVSDVPEEWKNGQNDLKITVHNGEQIEAEWNDVENTWDKIEETRPVRNLKSSVHRWATSDEMKHLEELDKKFVQSEEGKRLVSEWEDVFKTLDEVVYHNDKGIHIDNSAMPHLEDELDDVEHEYKKLEGSYWDKAYTQGWKAATHNRETGALKRRAEAFKESNEG